MRYFFILLLVGCSVRYEVIQEVHPGMYHTQGVKKKDVILYKTDLKLNQGDIVIIPNKAKRENKKELKDANK